MRLTATFVSSTGLAYNTKYQATITTGVTPQTRPICYFPSFLSSLSMSYILCMSSVLLSRKSFLDHSPGDGPFVYCWLFLLLLLLIPLLTPASRPVSLVNFYPHITGNLSKELEFDGYLCSLELIWVSYYRDNIQGYDDIKNIVRRTLDSDENYNLLLCGPPAAGIQKGSLLRWLKHICATNYRIVI